MSRRPQKRPDWPKIAAALAAEVPPAGLHPAPLQRARTEFLRETRRGARPSRWAVAFSGGADSLALLLLLWAAGPGRWGRNFVVLHFNHRLRGRESDADERFSRDVCAALGVTFVAGRWTQARKDASEAEAREARLGFFQREMKRRKLRLLWLAHQQDDVAESMLMRLARGSGAGGLAAPRPVQVQSDGRLHLRPLLHLRKSTLIAGLRRAGATWREDASNAGPAHFRNRVRRSVLPAWQKAAGRDAVAGAARARELLEEDDAALESWLDELRPLDARGTLDLRKLTGRPRALVRRALHRWVWAQPVEIRFSRQAFDTLLDALERGRDTRQSVALDAFAVLAGGRLRCERQRKTPRRFQSRPN